MLDFSHRLLSHLWTAGVAWRSTNWTCPWRQVAQLAAAHLVLLPSLRFIAKLNHGATWIHHESIYISTEGYTAAKLLPQLGHGSWWEACPTGRSGSWRINQQSSVLVKTSYVAWQNAFLWICVAPWNLFHSRICVYPSYHLAGETAQVSQCQVAKQATDLFVQPQVASPLGGWHSGRTWMLQISECGQNIRLSLKALCNTAERRVLTTTALT